MDSKMAQKNEDLLESHNAHVGAKSMLRNKLLIF
jgi:hypothetical protein